MKITISQKRIDEILDNVAWLELRTQDTIANFKNSKLYKRQYEAELYELYARQLFALRELDGVLAFL